MSRKKQPDKQTMTPMQKQAVLVCVICALAALLTIGITLTLLKKGKEPAAPSVSESTADGTDPSGENLAGHYQINNTSAALLTETDDAGEDYLNQVLFLGDSNTVRLYNNGLISLQQFCAKEGIGTQAALNDGIVTFKNDNNQYTIPEAVAKMKPRRIVMTFGTNDTGMDVEDFIAHYTALVQAVQSAYPYADIIINTVPPIPEDHSNYPHMDQAKIDDFNMALLSMCEQLNLKFLNSAETLKGDDGYGNAEYYTNGDIHLKTVGLKAVLTYIRTHAYNTEDRRPAGDLTGIPTRTLEYVSNPSSAVQAPSSSVPASESTAPSESASSSESTSSSESKDSAVQYEVRYQVEKSGGGSLSCGGDSGKSLSYKITDPAKSLTVTAVPADGYVFVKWSDGKTDKTRSDTNFTQNLDVTAVFAALSVKISGERRGESVVFQASVSGKYGSADSIRWYSNGTEVTAAAGQSKVTIPITNMTEATYKVHATVSYNGSSVSSNTLTITVVSGSSGSSSSSSSHPASSASSGTSSGSTSESTSSSVSHETASSSESTSHSSGSSSHSSSSESSSSSKAESAKEESNSESVNEAASSSQSEAASSEASASKEESKAE